MYDDSINALENNPLLQDDKGVKRKSIFNELLKHFHVCQPGLPPCIGHDLFEGVVQYDVALCIKKLVEKKYFTYVFLNNAIRNFTLKGMDASCCLNVINKNGKKLGGHVSQNWNLLRFLPLLIGYKAKDSKAWEMILCLREIVEHVCAPKISENQVGYLQILIQSYFEIRSEVFPDVHLKPKHHYISHYPHLIMQLGPLIRLWTLWYESKHQYFKRCVRNSQNFINITQTLAEKASVVSGLYQFWT